MFETCIYICIVVIDLYPVIGKCITDAFQVRMSELQIIFFAHKSHDVIKDKNGQVVELHCTYDPETRGGDSPDGRKVRGTLHWVSATHALDAEVRLYDHLFTKPDPDEVEEGQTFLSNLNPNSLEVLTGCKVEPSLAGAEPGSRYQFLRQGYFSIDPDTTKEQLVVNLTVPLRDTWAKIEAQQKG